MNFLNDVALIDSHCHVDLYKDYDQVIKEAEINRTFIVCVTNLPSIFQQDIKRLAKSPYIKISLGFHPQLVSSYANQIGMMSSLIPKSRFIGEIGLDYQTSNEEDKKKQKLIFEKILNECAKYKNKIFSIHSRGSASDVVSMIGANYPGNIILHWFSGPKIILNRAIKNGYYFSINPSMINTEKGRLTISLLPLERIITETDGPLIKISNRIVRQENINEVIKYLANHFKKDASQIKNILINNFFNLINHT